MQSTAGREFTGTSGARTNAFFQLPLIQICLYSNSCQPNNAFFVFYQPTENNHQYIRGNKSYYVAGIHCAHSINKLYNQTGKNGVSGVHKATPFNGKQTCEYCFSDNFTASQLNPQ